MDPAGKFSFPGLGPEAFAEWRTRHEVFQALEGWNYGTFILVGGVEPERINGAYVTPRLFTALGVSPVIGRAFEDGDGEPGRDAIVIISYGLWQQRFGLRNDAIGQPLILNDRRFRVVGVMPPHFRFPASHQVVWLPTPLRQAGNARLQAVALLQPALTQTAAQARLDTITAALAAEQPRPAGWRVRLTPMRGTDLNRWTERALEILTAAVFVVLLIACANLANLGFAQALSRRRELSIRAALGASRWRLIRELLAEHLVLGIAGGAIGLALASWGIGLALRIAPTAITLWTPNEARIDTRILAFTAITTIGSTLLCGLVPAWRASRADAGDALKSRTSGTARAHGGIRSTLVVVEVALSVVLVTGAALLIRSFVKLTHVDPGFEPNGLVAVSMEIPTDRYPSAARQAFFERVSQAVRAIPGVTAVSVANGVPTAGGNIHFGSLEIDGGAKDTHEIVLPDSVVDPAFFSTLGIPIVAGRGFRDGDAATAAVVSESFARRLVPHGSALGVRFRLFELDDWRTVIGIAREVHQSRSMERDTEFEMYSPLWRPGPRTPTATVSSAGGARSFVSLRLIVRAAATADLAAPIKAAIWSVDPGQPIGEIVPVSDLLAVSLAEDRFATILMGSFAVLALVIAAAGLYAVLAQLVAHRRQEIGIRIALGAAAADVRRLILGRGVAMTAAGIAIGLAGAWVSARFIALQLYEIAPHDPVSFVAVPIVLLAISAIASWAPARRALTVDPMEALRTE
jgi:predicted permease